MDILLLFWSILIRIIPQIQKIIYLSSPFLPPVSQSSCRRFSFFSPDLSWLTKDGCYTIPKGTHMLVSNDSKRNTDCFRKGNTYENKKNICADRRYSACGTIRFNCGFCSVRQSECHLFVQSFYLLYSYYSSHLIQLCFGVQDFWPQKTRFALQFGGSIFKKITFVNKIYISFMIRT